MRIKFLPLFVIALCLLSLPLLAQEAAEPTAEISWPPPVYVLRGETSLRGTVNLADMTGYFIEYRALDEDLSAPDTRLTGCPLPCPPQSRSWMTCWAPGTPAGSLTGCTSCA